MLLAAPFFAALCSALLVSTPVLAQTPSETEPVGFYTITLKGASDNPISFPMARPHVFAGAVASVTANTITIANTPAFTASQFVYNGTTQRETYYLEIVSGNFTGSRYKITGNDTATLTLDTEGDNLTSHPTFGAVAANTLVRIFPYWRIKDIFESNGVPLIEARPNAFTVRDQILFPDYVSVAQNKPSPLIVYYVANVGWRAAGQGSTDYADQVIRFNEAVIVRRNNIADLNLVNLGQVQMVRSVSFVPGGDTVNGNDTFISINHPAPVTLAQSGLYNSTSPDSSVIRPSSAAFNIVDRLLAFDPAATGLNPAAPDIYYYLANVGWRKVGAPNDDASGVLLHPGRAYIARKNRTSPGVDWLKDVNY
jgi:uncharacterized protein (TIGR02597 family)